MLISLLIILLLLGFSASFSSLETALFSLSPLERHRLKSGSGLSTLIAKVLDKPRELLTTVLFGNELVNVAISILAGGIAYDLFEGYNRRLVYLLAIGVTTFFLLVFGEILPKNLAIRNSVMVSQLLILPYRLFSWGVSPFRFLLTQMSDRVVAWFGGDPKKGRMIVEEELKMLLEMGRQEGTLADLETTLIHNAIDFSGVLVSEVMTPRPKIVAIPSRLSLQEVLDFLYENRFSRLPVIEGDLDHVVGILYAKELIGLRLGPDQEKPLQEILKPFATVRPEQRLSEVYQEFKKQRIHMGIVKGEEGSTVGLITMDDLLRRFFQ